MIIFFDISLIAFVVLFGILLVCGMFNSMLSVYNWFISNIIWLLLIFIAKAVIHCILLLKNIKPKKSKAGHVIVAVIANILQIISFWVFIKEMAAFQIDHPVITVICTLFAVAGFGFPLLLSLFGGFDEEFNTVACIACIICCILLIIACVVPSLGWKVFICFMSAIIGFFCFGVLGG